jgi:hypothetical protein
LRGSSSLLVWAAWLVALAALAVVTSALAGIRWWVTLAVILGAALLVGAFTAVLLRRPK